MFTLPRLFSIISHTAEENNPLFSKHPEFFDISNENNFHIEDDPEYKKLFNIIKAAFSQRRKKLSNSLSNNPALGVSRQEVADALLKMGGDEKARGEILTLEQFAELSDILQR